MSLTRAPFFIPHGTTDGLDFELRDLSATSASEDGDLIDLTGLTVTLDVWTRAGVVKVLPGTVSIVSASIGHVRYAPADADDFDDYADEAPYLVRWKVSDGADHFFVPSGTERDRWAVAP